jgi:hypothetical protein
VFVFVFFFLDILITFTSFIDNYTLKHYSLQGKIMKRFILKESVLRQIIKLRLLTEATADKIEDVDKDDPLTYLPATYKWYEENVNLSSLENLDLKKSMRINSAINSYASPITSGKKHTRINDVQFNWGNFKGDLGVYYQFTRLDPTSDNPFGLGPIQIANDPYTYGLEQVESKFDDQLANLNPRLKLLSPESFKDKLKLYVVSGPMPVKDVESSIKSKYMPNVPLSNILTDPDPEITGSRKKEIILKFIGNQESLDSEKGISSGTIDGEDVKTWLSGYFDKIAGSGHRVGKAIDFPTKPYNDDGEALIDAIIKLKSTGDLVTGLEYNDERYKSVTTNAKGSTISGNKKASKGRHIHVELTDAKITEAGYDLIQSAAIVTISDAKKYFANVNSELNNAESITQDFVRVIAAIISLNSTPKIKEPEKEKAATDVPELLGAVTPEAESAPKANADVEAVTNWDHKEYINGFEDKALIVGDISRSSNDQSRIMASNVQNKEKSSPGEGISWALSTYKNRKLSAAFALAALGEDVKFDDFALNLARCILITKYFGMPDLKRSIYAAAKVAKVPNSIIK